MINFFNCRLPSLRSIHGPTAQQSLKRTAKQSLKQTVKQTARLGVACFVAMTCVLLFDANATYGQSFLEKLESVVRDKLNNSPSDPKLVPKSDGRPQQAPVSTPDKPAGNAGVAGEELPAPRQNPSSQNLPPKPVDPARTEKMPSILERDQAIVPSPRGSQELELSPAGKQPVEVVNENASGVYLGLEAEELVGGGIGVRVASLNENSPAWKAGFKVGDLLQAIDGYAIADLDGMANRLRRVVPGRPTKFLVKRAGRNMELTAVLQNAAIAERLGVTADPVDGPAYLGVTASDLTPAFRTQFGLAVFSGAAVTNVARESPAYAAGVRPGDAIVEINGVPVDSSADLQRWIGGAQAGQPTELMVYRGTQPSMKSLVLSGVPQTGVIAERPRINSRPSVATTPQPRVAGSLQSEVEQLRSELAQTQQQLLQTQQRLEQVLQQMERIR